jgi:hypothetical protein
MNWGQFLTELRSELKDDGTTQKFSDDLLYVFLRDGIWALSEWLPRDIGRITLTAEETDPKKFALPTDFIEEYLVECPLDNALTFRYVRPGVRRATSVRPLFYWTNTGYLFLDADPGENAVLISYYGVHGIPADASDQTFDLTVPMRDIELLKLYIFGRVFQRERSRQSLLDRFKVGTGDRQDNPIEPEVVDYMGQFNEKLAERIGGKAVFLTRERRRK